MDEDVAVRFALGSMIYTAWPGSLLLIFLELICPFLCSLSVGCFFFPSRHLFKFVKHGYKAVLDFFFSSLKKEPNLKASNFLHKVPVDTEIYKVQSMHPLVEVQVCGSNHPCGSCGLQNCHVHRD